MQVKAIKEKSKQTCLQKYGTECSLSSPIVIAKKEETCLKKYGNKSLLAIPEFREKTKQYFLTNFNVEYATQVPEIKEKQKQTLLKNIGYDNPFKSPKIREKSKQSLIKRFGTDCSLNVPEIREKGKQTLKEKYNVESIFQSSYIRNICRQNSFDKFWKTIESWLNYIIPLFNRSEFNGIKNNIYSWKCTKCGNEFKTHIHTTRHLSEKGSLSICPRCLNCYPFIENLFVSKTELELRIFCQQYFSKLQHNIKTIITPYELDIYIPEIKLALEFNGDYFHSIEAGTPTGYHLMKTKMCENLNIRLIHIWEYQWNNNKNEIKQKLINIFNNKEIINYSNILDRSWFPLIDLNNQYNIIEIKPAIIPLDNKRLHIENCGYLKYEKKN